MAVPPPELDPETVLELSRIAEEEQLAATGGSTQNRVNQAIARRAYVLGWQAGLSASGTGRTVLTSAEYAARAGVTTRWVRHLARAGRLPARRTSAGWVIEADGAVR